ncbi:MAG TPA: ribbon-helix-helix protein, CopG family [Saprospiraceae bacterium]|nr:ribbon-helix-helix protein, CopG family [Saprospiraceae bacterium]HHH52223.1 ribbon-helix-helix protein, CopG family [Bacteroidota bacterium]
MKSITIHKLDNDIASAIEKIAKSTGLSQNKIIKQLLRKSLGLNKKKTIKRDVSILFDIWSDREVSELENSIKIFDKIDEDLWK